MKQLLLVTLSVFLTVQLSFAQYSGAKDGVGLRAQFYNYQLPINNKFDTDQFKENIK